MNFTKLFLFSLALVLVTGAYPQATPSEQPGYKPTVFPRKEEKVDKSRLRDLKGVVKDEADNPVEGAIIQLKNLKSNKVVEFITKQDGAYLFYDLNMDVDYELTAARDGFNPGPKKTLTKYDSRKPATLNLQLEHKKPA